MDWGGSSEKPLGKTDFGVFYTYLQHTARLSCVYLTHLQLHLLQFIVYAMMQ